MVWPFLPHDETPVLRGTRIVLRGPKPSDYVAWRNLRRDSREFLKPYEPRWTEADLTKRVFTARLSRGRQEAAQATDYNFLVLALNGSKETLVGGLTLSNIRRRAAQHANLGYWMGKDHAGQGLMTEAVGVVIPHAFNTLGLHRIHAAFLPGNTASRRVLEKNGFAEEGYAQNYLQIDGRWADHVLFGLTREQFDLIQRRGPR